MRKPRFAFTVLIFLFLFSPCLWANDRDKFEEVAGKGLEIHTNPLVAKVYIDGTEYGSTPLHIDNLQPGRYRIEIIKEEYEDRVFNVILREDSLLIITVEMEPARGIAYISVQKAQDSPGDLPFVPQLFSTGQDNSLSVVPLSHDNKALLNLTLNHRHVIRARAFGWEDESIAVFVRDKKPAEETIVMKPAEFKMENASQSRRRFNPVNSKSFNSAEYHFEVSAHGQGTIIIYDSNGNEVYKKQLGQFDTWIQQASWDGKDSDGNVMPQGLYTVVIEAQDAKGETHSLKLETEINYSINIFPLSLECPVAGLSFVPMPHTLPRGSFQFNAGTIFGSFNFPFKINIRYSPVNSFEITTVFNLIPDNTRTGWGISGSAKYNFLDGSKFPLALSASVSYAWSSETGEYKLSNGKGVGVYAPLSLELSDFSIAFCPSAFWRGPVSAVPELHLGAGVLYRRNLITAGVSARGEIEFKENKFKLLAGAEVHIIPPQSNIVITLHGGIINSAGLSWYAGLGIGLIH